MNLCRGCGLDFGSVGAFDRHRVGRHAYTFREGLALEPPREDGRRCVDEHELGDAGLGLDGRGRWSLVDDVERARARFAEPVEIATGVDGEATGAVAPTPERVAT